MRKYEDQLKHLLLACATACAGLASLTGCDDGGSGARGAVPWESDRSAVISPDGRITELTPGPAGECLPFERGDQCIDPVESCGAGVASDVIVDADGKLLDIVCYPAGETLTVEEIEARAGDVSQNENDAVIVLDGVNDGVDLDGNLDVDANNVVIYGDGPDVSSMSGDLVLDGNNIVVRGIRIEGDVRIVKNNTIMLFCVIEGDLTITANDTRISGCDIYGDVRIEGNNTELNGVRIQGKLEINGKNTECPQTRSFTDADSDFVVLDSELGSELTCKRK